MIDSVFEGITIKWDSPSVPLGICQKCRNDTNRMKDGKPPVTEIPLVDFSSIMVPQNLPPGTPCECQICSQVHKKGSAPGKPSADTIASISPIDHVPLGKAGRKRKELTEEELQDSPDFPANTPPEPVEICPRCLVTIPKGQRHDKCSKPEMRKQMVDLSLKHPKSGGMAAAALLKEKPKGTVFLSQQKGGPKLPVNIGHATSKESTKVIPTKVIESIGKELRLSNNQRTSMTIMLNSARDDHQKIVETGTLQKLADKALEIAQLHARSEIEIQGKSYPVLHVTNLNSFIEHVLEKRGLQRSDVIARLSLDFGQGSLKISLNIIDMVSQESIMQYGSKTRRLGEFKDSGVQKIFILTEAENLEESHEAFEKLFELINVGDTEFTNACDFKAGNILAGISTAMAAYSCLYCEALNDRDGHGLETLGDMRTIQNVTDNYEAWIRAKANTSKTQHKKDLRIYKSCVNKPILFGKPTDQILQHIAPGELHIHLGLTDYLIKRIRRIWHQVDKWLDEIGIARNQYGTHNLNGNHCQIILEHADQLQNVQKFEVQPFAETFRALRKVIHTCFGMELVEGWEANIKEFALTWAKLVDFFDTYPFEEPQTKIMYTEKVHVLIHHVPQYCKMYNTGLGVWAEQAGESLHSKRRKHKEFYRNVPKHIVEDPELCCLVDFNSKQI